MTGIFRRRREDTPRDTQGRQPREDGARDWS